jgi:uncharacterized protein (TIGR03435 family)
MYTNQRGAALRTTILACALFVPAVCLFCRAQQPASTPAFEVASVKPSQPTTGDTFTVGMGGDSAIQNYANVSLRSLILGAYRIKDYQLTGPDWMDEALFDIRAKLSQGASRSQVPAMMQKLLADRFHLTLHRETKELPVYVLVVAKGGIKTHPPDTKDGPKQMPDGTYTVTGGLSGPGTISLTGTKTSADDLAELLSNSTDRPVLDKTGLTGSYEFKMRWQDAESVSLSAALEENLGLKVESRKASIEILVIDHVDKVPVGN